MRPNLTKPAIGHLCHGSFSLNCNRNITTILDAMGASVKVFDVGFVGSGHMSPIHVCKRIAAVERLIQKLEKWHLNLEFIMIPSSETIS